MPGISLDPRQDHRLIVPASLFFRIELKLEKFPYPGVCLYPLRYFANVYSGDNAGANIRSILLFLSFLDV